MTNAEDFQESQTIQKVIGICPNYVGMNSGGGQQMFLYSTQ